MIKRWHTLTVIAATSLFSSLTLLASAQSSSDLKGEIISTLESGNTDKALALASTLYDTSRKAKNHSEAGYAAYAKAQIFDMKNLPLEAAKAYGQCGSEYENADSAAQSLQCQYQSGLAYISAGKTGTAGDVLKGAIKDLEKINQDKSELAANSYLALAKISLPSKLSGNQAARDKRKNAINYADKAMTALQASGQKNSHKYASISFLKGIAFEDMEDFESAKSIYISTLKLAESNSQTPVDFLRNVQTRLNVMKSRTADKKSRNILTVANTYGEDVELRVKKKRDIKIPRPNKNQMIDGASVKARITLGADGKVSNIEILESIPSREYGDAFLKGVKTWKFIPPPGISGLDIEPFIYNMTFSVGRR